MKDKINIMALLLIAITVSSVLSYKKGKQDGISDFLPAANKKIHNCLEVILVGDKRTKQIKKDTFLSSSYFFSKDTN